MKDVRDMTPAEALAEANRRSGRRSQGLPVTPAEQELELARQTIEKEKDERLEREIQAECVKRYRAAGCEVYDLSQKKAHKMTPGIADLMVFPPGSIGSSFWHEVKTPDGRQSPDQKVFQENCERCGVTYVLGGVAAARAQLRKLGLRDDV